MAWYVDADGKTVHRYTQVAGGIKLSLATGGEGFMPQEEVEKCNHRLFAVHPDMNRNCTRDTDGVIVYRGERLAPPAPDPYPSVLKAIEANSLKDLPPGAPTHRMVELEGGDVRFEPVSPRKPFFGGEGSVLHDESLKGMREIADEEFIKHADAARAEMEE